MPPKRTERLQPKSMAGEYLLGYLEGRGWQILYNFVGGPRAVMISALKPWDLTTCRDTRGPDELLSIPRHTQIRDLADTWLVRRTHRN